MKKIVMYCIILALSVSISPITKEEFLQKYTKGTVLVVKTGQLPKGIIDNITTIESDGTIYALKGRENSVSYFKQGTRLTVKRRKLRKERFELTTISSPEKAEHKWLFYYDKPDQLARNMERFFSVQSEQEPPAFQTPEKISVSQTTKQKPPTKPKVLKSEKQPSTNKTKIIPKVTKSEKKAAKPVVEKKKVKKILSSKPKKKVPSREEFLHIYSRGRFLVLQLNKIPITLNGGRIEVDSQGLIQESGQNGPGFNQGDILEIKSVTLTRTSCRFTTLAVRVGRGNSPRYINTWTFLYQNPGQLVRNLEKYFLVYNSLNRARQER